MKVSFGAVGRFDSFISPEEILGTLSQGEMQQWASSLASPDRNIFRGEGGLASAKDGKLLYATEDMDFSTRSISDNRDVYGTSSGTSKECAGAYLNALDSAAPVRLPGTSLVPDAVSANRLAVSGEQPGR